MVKVDPHNFKGKWDNWKSKGQKLEGLNSVNRKLVIQYLDDMELGHNINPSSKKGARSYGRLYNQKTKVLNLFILIQTHVKSNVKKLTEKDLLLFFKLMRDGKIMSPKYKRPYKDVGTYTKAFKTIWHWHMRSQRKNGVTIPDITAELDTKTAKPSFHYFTDKDLQQMCNKATFDYKVLMMFLFDSGIRAPTELMNMKVSDLSFNEKDGYYVLHIRDEVSKTFGRKIKLLLCSQILKEYIQNKKLKNNDYIFNGFYKNYNRTLSRLGYKVLGMGKTVERKSSKDSVRVTSGITMYDFRHSSACYWVMRYKSESALKYRFGWKRSEMIHYYTELLGMKDTIEETDQYVDVTKTELEKEITRIKNDYAIKEENFNARFEKQDLLIAENKRMMEIMNILLKEKDKFNQKV